MGTKNLPEMLFTVFVVLGTIGGILGQVHTALWCFGGAGMLWLGKLG